MFQLTIDADFVLLTLSRFIDLSKRPEHGQEGLVIRIRVDETTEAASARHQVVGLCDQDRWAGIELSIFCLEDSEDYHYLHISIMGPSKNI